MMSIDLSKLDFIKKISQLDSVEQIILYGSRAKKLAEERSDIDLAIVFSSDNYSDWYKIKNIVDEADTLLKVDCVNFNTISDQSAFKNKILENHIVLFSRKDFMQEKLNRSLAVKLAYDRQMLGAPHRTGAYDCVREDSRSGVTKQLSSEVEFFKRSNEKIDFLEYALNRLEGILGWHGVIKEANDMQRAQIDSSIQRFEFCFELFWKTLKVVLATLGEKVEYPKDVLRASYKGNLINDEAIWLGMLSDRNETSHVYDQEIADRVYNSIRNDYFNVLKSTFLDIKTKFYKA